MLPTSFPAALIDRSDYDPHRGPVTVGLTDMVVCHRTDTEGMIEVVDHHNAASYLVEVGPVWRGEPIALAGPDLDAEPTYRPDPNGPLVLLCDTEACLPDCE